MNYGKSNQCGANLTLSWDIGGITLRSISGYVNIDDKFGFDLAGGGFLGVPGTPGLLIASDSNFDQASEELQVLGTAFEARLNYLVGLFYLNEDGTQQFSGDLFGPAFAEDIHNDTNSYAAFADGTVKITDRPLLHRRRALDEGREGLFRRLHRPLLFRRQRPDDTHPGQRLGFTER